MYFVFQLLQHFNRLYKSVFHGFLKIETWHIKASIILTTSTKVVDLEFVLGPSSSWVLERVPAVLNLRSKRNEYLFSHFLDSDLSLDFLAQTVVVTYFIFCICLIYNYHFFKFILFLFFVLFCIVESNCWN